MQNNKTILRLVTSTNCNLSCIYCHKEGNILNKDQSSDYSFKEMQSWLELIKTVGINSVVITGGEPLLVPNIKNLLSFIKKYFKSIHLSTNGTLLNEQVIAFLKMYNIERLNISLDSVSNKKIIDITKFDLLNDILYSAKKAYEAGIKINFNMVILPNINDSPNEILEYIKLVKPFAEKISLIRPHASLNPIATVYSQEFDLKKFLMLLGKLAEKKYKKKYSGSMEQNIYIIDNFPVSMYVTPKFSSLYCKNCTQKNICTEGIVSPRLDLNGILRLCLLRPNVNIDLKKIVLLPVKDKLKEIKSFLEVYN